MDGFYFVVDGEEIKAVVVKKAGDGTTEAELTAWGKEQFAGYKYPRIVEFVDALPMTATGKILKRELSWKARPSPAPRVPCALPTPRGCHPRTKVTRGAGSPAAALAMFFKRVESAQQRWRTVNAPHLVALVRAGARFERGLLVERPKAAV